MSVQNISDKKNNTTTNATNNRDKFKTTIQKIQIEKRRRFKRRIQIH